MDEILKCDHSMRTTEQYFPVVLFIMLHKVVASNFCVCGLNPKVTIQMKASKQVLSRYAVYFSTFCKTKFGIFQVSTSAIPDIETVMRNKNSHLLLLETQTPSQIQNHLQSLRSSYPWSNQHCSHQ